jgi:hypothetical protein
MCTYTYNDVPQTIRPDQAVAVTISFTILQAILDNGVGSLPVSAWKGNTKL